MRREGRATIETGDAVPSPGAASSLIRWLVDEDRSASRGNRMRTEVKWSTDKAVVSRYRWVRLPYRGTNKYP